MLKNGEKAPLFQFMNQHSETVDFEKIISSNNKTVLLFLRYYGCTICQLDLIEYKERYKEFTDKNTDVIIVLQSSPKTVNKTHLPYNVACDSEMILYKKYNVEAAKSTLKMVNIKAIKKVNKAKKAGIKHGEYEGIETQLPACFIIDNEGTIVYSHYAKKVADIPSIDEILELL